MLKLLLGVVSEVFVAVLLAGLVLAAAIPLLNRSGLVTAGDLLSTIIIVAVLVAALAVALFRPGSAMRRHLAR